MENRTGKGATMLFASAVVSDEQQGDLIICWPMPKAQTPGFRIIGTWRYSTSRNKWSWQWVCDKSSGVCPAVYYCRGTKQRLPKGSWGDMPIQAGWWKSAVAWRKRQKSTGQVGGV